MHIVRDMREQLERLENLATDLQTPDKVLVGIGHLQEMARILSSRLVGVLYDPRLLDRQVDIPRRKAPGRRRAPVASGSRANSAAPVDKLPRSSGGPPGLPLSS